MESILANEQILNALIAVLGFAVTGVVTYVGKKVNRYLQDEENRKVITEVFDKAVWDTYETFVKEIKASSKDGKLTKAEAKQAMDRSISKVKQFARDEGFDVLKELGEPVIRRLIENTIQKFKMGGGKP